MVGKIGGVEVAKWTNLVRRTKERLVSLGISHPIVLSTLQAYGLMHGYRVDAVDGTIVLRKVNKVMVLRERDFTFVPYLVAEAFDAYFRAIEGETVGDDIVLDFSGPRLHRYPRWDLELVFPGIPEDDSIESYTSRCRPGEGMVVFDVGAHAGFTTYFLSRMVGDAGRVYSFEPDDTSRAYLVENTRRIGLRNVTVIEAALGGYSGRAVFNMDGSVSAGLTDFLAHPDTGYQKEVEVITVEDCCKRIGQVPDFVKMDIEGAEVAVVKSSLGFLSDNPIAFAIASYHRTDEGEQTYHELEALFQSIDYQVESSDEFGHTLTWARPRQ